MREIEPPAPEVPTRLAPYMRPAWFPLVEEGGGGPYDSKFAGVPWLAESEGWPRCPNCGKSIKFLLQLNLDQLPEAVGGEYGAGLVQLFYCTNTKPQCDTECQAFAPFAKSVVVRLVTPEVGAPQPSKAAGGGHTFPPKRIVGWREAEDYPTPEEAAWMGVELDEDEWNAAAESEECALGGDKLGGWPQWVQDMEYPECPECGRQMRLVFQIASEDNLPIWWGDLGIGHVTQCPEHKHVLAFGWAC